MSAPKLRPGLPDTPASMASLPLEQRGYPVPFFADVNPVTREPDLRIMDPVKLVRCITANLCWVCGRPLQWSARVFALGMMGAINRVNSEPPGHPECMRYSAVACPFMSRGHMARSEKTDIPKTVHVETGIDDNPGVWALFWASTYSYQVEPKGVLFLLNEPKMIEFWTRGRRATRAEVLNGVDKAMQRLVPIATAEGNLASVEAGLKRLRPSFPKE